MSPRQILVDDSRPGLQRGFIRDTFTANRLPVDIPAERVDPIDMDPPSVW